MIDYREEKKKIYIPRNYLCYTHLASVASILNQLCGAAVGAAFRCARQVWREGEKVREGEERRTIRRHH